MRNEDEFLKSVKDIFCLLDPSGKSEPEPLDFFQHVSEWCTDITIAVTLFMEDLSKAVEQIWWILNNIIEKITIEIADSIKDWNRVSGTELYDRS